MFKQLSLVSTMVIGSVLFLGNGLPSVAVAQEKSIEQMAPKSGWSVARIDGAAAVDSYCALSRQYDKGFVLTLGRNQAEEYSLAIDFQSARLNVEKAYSMTLQPGPGQIRAYEMMPASQRAMVVRLGYDDSFFNALEESNLLKAEIDGTNYQFQMSDFKAGKADLNNCLSGLKGNSSTKVASGFSAEKVDDASPIKVKKEEPQKQLEAKAEPKKEVKEEPKKIEMSKVDAPAETKLAEVVPKDETPRKPVLIEKVESAPQELVEQSGMPEPLVPAAAPSKPSATKAIEISRVETKQLTPVVEPKTEMPKVEAPKVESENIETPKPNPPKIEMAKVETEAPSLETPIEATPSSEMLKIEMAKVDSVVSKAPDIKSSNFVMSNNDELLAKVHGNRQVSEMVETKSTGSISQQTTLQKQQREALEQLKADNERLNKALQAEITKPESQVPDRSNEVASLQAQIGQLQSELDKVKNTPDPIDEELKADVEKLRQENEQLKLAMQVKAETEAQAKAEALAQAQAAEQAKAKAQAEAAAAAQAIAQAEAATAAQAKAEAEAAAQAQAKAAAEAEAAEARAMAQMQAQAKAEAEAAEAKAQALADAKAQAQTQEVTEAQNKAAQALAIQESAEQAQAEKIIPMVDDVPEKIVSVDPEIMRELDSLKQENTRLSAALQGQEQKLSSFDAQSPEAEKELTAIREQLKEIQEENKKLYEQAQKNRGFVDTAVAQTSSEALKKMQEYEKKLEAAQNDNLQLSKEIEELRRMKEDGRLAAVGGDWDLEKSTKRYNEAEREIKRLGLLLEQQRMAHRQEKEELEQMLFDPAVTDQEQRRRLAELEAQLAAAERELQSAGRAMPQNDMRTTMVPLSPLEERVTLGSLAPNAEVTKQRENLEIQRLNNKVARQNQQLQAYNSALQTERMAAVPSPSVSAQPLANVRSNQPIERLPTPTMVEPPQAVNQQPRAPIPVVQSMESTMPKQVEASSSDGFGLTQLQQVLSNSGLSISGKITKQAEGQYRWNANNLVGQAQIVPMSQAGSVNQFAQGYIANAKKACGGDFASLPATASGQGQSFEIACISPSRSTSSSVIFTQKGNDLIAISHESSAENMDMAMDARDRVASSL